MTSILAEISGNRPSEHEFSPLVRASIISKWEEGVGPTKLAEQFGTRRQVISRIIKKFQVTGSVESQPRSGRPRKLSHRDKRAIIRQVRKTPKISYEDLKLDLELTTVSHDTIYRILREHGLTNKLCIKRPKLTPTVARLRLKFARENKDFNWRRQTVMFSDECSVEVGSGASREWAFRFPSEKYEYKMIQEKDKGGKPSQMVWGCFWVDTRGRIGRSELVIMTRDPTSPRGGYSAESYIKTLQEGLMPYYRPGQIFQQDNAPIHTANKTKDYLELHGIWVMEWPPFSPDLNPIEHLWYALKQMMWKEYPELRQIGRNTGDWERFCEALKDCWQRLPNSLLRKLIYSVPDRLAAVRAAKGWQTKY